MDQERGLKDCPALDLRRARRPALRWRREWPQRGHCHQRVRRSVCQRTPFLPVRPSPLSPNSEEGNEIEKTRRAPSAVGRVTPCAPRLQPAGAKFPSRRLPDPLSIKTFLEFPVRTSEFGVAAWVEPASCRISFGPAVGNVPALCAKWTRFPPARKFRQKYFLAPQLVAINALAANNPVFPDPAILRVK